MTTAAVAKKPLIEITKPQRVTLAELEARIRETRARHAQLLQEYHRVWYECGHTWTFCSFLGVGLMKNPNDLWAYQTIISQHRPQTIIETGTLHGASALWYAFLLDALGIDGRVYTIDIEDGHQVQHPRITFIHHDSTDPDLVNDLRAQVKGPVLISLDSDHSEQHVYEELSLYAPLTQPGDWVVVEDTNISWGGPTGDRGARGGAERYLLEHPGEFRQDLLSERFLLSMNPGGWLQRIAPCGHHG